MNLSKGYWVQSGVGSLKQDIEAGVLRDVRFIDFRHGIQPIVIG